MQKNRKNPLVHPFVCIWEHELPTTNSRIRPFPISIYLVLYIIFICLNHKYENILARHIEIYEKNNII